MSEKQLFRVANGQGKSFLVDWPAIRTVMGKLERKGIPKLWENLPLTGSPNLIPKAKSNYESNFLSKLIGLKGIWEGEKRQSGIR